MAFDGDVLKLRDDGSIDDDRYVLVNDSPFKLRNGDSDASSEDESENLYCTDSDDTVIGSLLSEDVFGEGGDDLLKGKGDDDRLYGGNGSDSLYGGGGDDSVRGGSGSDLVAGGLGVNVFDDCEDGFDDIIKVKSDQVFGGNNIDGSLADLVSGIDLDDSIVVLGVETEVLTFGMANMAIGGLSYVGLGVFANGALEALVVDDDLTLRQLEELTTGVIE